MGILIMKKSRIISVIAILATMLMMMSCGYKNGPPGDDAPWPENLDGEFASEYGSMHFTGDGESITVNFSDELSQALGCQTGELEGTYVFLFDHKAWRYDKSDEFDISIGDSAYYFTNVFTQTNEDRIVLSLPEFNDNEPIFFEKVKSAETEQKNDIENLDSISSEKEKKEELAVTSETAYKDFLAKKNTVSYAGRDMTYVTNGAQYRIYDLINSCTNCSEEDYDTIVENTEIFEQRVDIGKDGVPEMTLRISNDTPNMGQVNYVFVIKYVEGELKIVSTSNGAYRSFAMVNEDGVVVYGGSGGASHYYESYDYVSPDGEDAAFYAMDVEMYAQKAIVPGYMLDDCPEDYPSDFGDESDDVVMKTYTLGREEGAPVYVVFEDQDGNSVPAMTGYEDLWKKNGIRVVNQNEAEKKIQELLDTVSGKYESAQAKELSWNTLDMTKYENIYGMDCLNREKWCIVLR